MKRFDNGQRVIVKATGEYQVLPLEKPIAGTVVRLRRCDYGAWIALDELAANEHHPFPPEDSRGRHVLAYPEDCEPEVLP